MGYHDTLGAAKGQQPRPDQTQRKDSTMTAPHVIITPQATHQERTIARLARELSLTSYAVEANSLLAGENINLDRSPRLDAIVATRLSPEAAHRLISKLTQLAARAANDRRPRGTWAPKSNGAWDRMEMPERYQWIASLSDWKVIEQAGVRARASNTSVSQVLIAWVLNGVLTYEHRLALHAALEGLVGISPADFYDLIRRDRFRASLALALLGSDGRHAFAAAFGELLGQLYGLAVPAHAVEATWRRAGLVEA